MEAYKILHQWFGKKAKRHGISGVEAKGNQA
jgi:hypothetical protein